MPSKFNFVRDVLGQNDKRSNPEARTTRGTLAPQTDTRTDHALSIRVHGQTIGHLQDWGPSQARTITPLYEINSAGPGLVVENVPGILGGLTINVGRFDLYTDKMENVWGPNFNIIMLTDQNNPLSINERWDNPDGTIEIYTYAGCWFTSLGRSHSSQGDRITRVSATLAYVKKYKVGEIKSYVDELVSGYVEKKFKNMFS